jgi:hypothetical protein
MADQLMMLEMHVADKGVIGKTHRALFAAGERHGNPAGVFVRHGPGRHCRNRDDKRNCKDTGDDPSAQRTPSMNRSIVSMPSVTEHAPLYSNSLFWGKDPTVHSQNVEANATWRDLAAKLMAEPRCCRAKARQQVGVFM